MELAELAELGEPAELGKPVKLRELAEVGTKLNTNYAKSVQL